jgi:hypothetical protein
VMRAIKNVSLSNRTVMVTIHQVGGWRVAGGRTPGGPTRLPAFLPVDALPPPHHPFAPLPPLCSPPWSCLRRLTCWCCCSAAGG